MPKQFDPRAWVRTHEGFRDDVYLDSLGKPTVGVGHLITPTSPFYGKQVGDVVDAADLESQYIKDYMHHADIAKKNFKNFDKHPQHVQDALINMTFQMGNKPSKWKNFNAALEKGLETGDYREAAYHGADSKWFREQTPDRAKSVLDRLAYGSGYGYTRPEGLGDYWSELPTGPVPQVATPTGTATAPGVIELDPADVPSAGPAPAELMSNPTAPPAQFKPVQDPRTLELDDWQVTGLDDLGAKLQGYAGKLGFADGFDWSRFSPEELQYFQSLPAEEQARMMGVAKAETALAVPPVGAEVPGWMVPSVQQEDVISKAKEDYSKAAEDRHSKYREVLGYAGGEWNVGLSEGLYKEINSMKLTNPEAGPSDTVPAMLTPGEAVIPASVAMDEDYKPLIKEMVEEGRKRNRKAESIGVPVNHPSVPGLADGSYEYLLPDPRDLRAPPRPEKLPPEPDWDQKAKDITVGAAKDLSGVSDVEDFIEAVDNKDWLKAAALAAVIGVSAFPLLKAARGGKVAAKLGRRLDKLNDARKAAKAARASKVDEVGEYVKDVEDVRAARLPSAEEKARLGWGEDLGYGDEHALPDFDWVQDESDYESLARQFDLDVDDVKEIVHDTWETRAKRNAAAGNPYGAHWSTNPYTGERVQLKDGSSCVHGYAGGGTVTGACPSCDAEGYADGTSLLERGQRWVAENPEYSVPAMAAGNIITDFIPGIGEAKDAYRAFDAAKSGNYGKAALLGGAAAIGLVPGVGDAVAGALRPIAGKIGGKLGKKALQKSSSKLPYLTQAAEQFVRPQDVYQGGLNVAAEVGEYLPAIPEVGREVLGFEGQGFANGWFNIPRAGEAPDQSAKLAWANTVNTGGLYSDPEEDAYHRRNLTGKYKDPAEIAAERAAEEARKAAAEAAADRYRRAQAAAKERRRQAEKFEADQRRQAEAAENKKRNQRYWGLQQDPDAKWNPQTEREYGVRTKHWIAPPSIRGFQDGTATLPPGTPLGGGHFIGDGHDHSFNIADQGLEMFEEDGQRFYARGGAGANYPAITQAEASKLVNLLAPKYGVDTPNVRMFYQPADDEGRITYGSYDPNTGEISFNTAARRPGQEWAQTIYHELGHKADVEKHRGYEGAVSNPHGSHYGADSPHDKYFDYLVNRQLAPSSHDITRMTHHYLSPKVHEYGPDGNIREKAGVTTEQRPDPTYFDSPAYQKYMESKMKEKGPRVTAYPSSVPGSHGFQGGTDMIPKPMGAPPKYNIEEPGYKHFDQAEMGQGTSMEMTNAKHKQAIANKEGSQAQKMDHMQQTDMYKLQMDAMKGDQKLAQKQQEKAMDMDMKLMEADVDNEVTRRKQEALTTSMAGLGMTPPAPMQEPPMPMEGFGEGPFGAGFDQALEAADTAEALQGFSPVAGYADGKEGKGLRESFVDSMKYSPLGHIVGTANAYQAGQHLGRAIHGDDNRGSHAWEATKHATKALTPAAMLAMGAWAPNPLGLAVGGGLMAEKLRPEHDITPETGYADGKMGELDKIKHGLQQDTGAIWPGIVEQVNAYGGGTYSPGAVMGQFYGLGHKMAEAHDVERMAAEAAAERARLGFADGTLPNPEDAPAEDEGWSLRGGLNKLGGLGDQAFKAGQSLGGWLEPSVPEVPVPPSVPTGPEAPLADASDYAARAAAGQPTQSWDEVVWREEQAKKKAEEAKQVEATSAASRAKNHNKAAAARATEVLNDPTADPAAKVDAQRELDRANRANADIDADVQASAARVLGVGNDTGQDEMMKDPNGNPIVQYTEEQKKELQKWAESPTDGVVTDDAGNEVVIAGGAESKRRAAQAAETASGDEKRGWLSAVGDVFKNALGDLADPNSLATAAIVYGANKLLGYDDNVAGREALKFFNQGLQQKQQAAASLAQRQAERQDFAYQEKVKAEAGAYEQSLKDRLPGKQGEWVQNARAYNTKIAEDAFAKGGLGVDPETGQRYIQASPEKLSAEHTQWMKENGITDYESEAASTTFESALTRASEQARATGKQPRSIKPFLQASLMDRPTGLGSGAFSIDGKPMEVGRLKNIRDRLAVTGVGAGIEQGAADITVNRRLEALGLAFKKLTNENPAKLKELQSKADKRGDVTPFFLYIEERLAKV